MKFEKQYQIFQIKIKQAFEAHQIQVHDQDLIFTEAALAAAKYGKWNFAAIELSKLLKDKLFHILSENHKFLEHPYIRFIALPNSQSISIAIINEQSKEWYGTENSIGSFDFILENERQTFKNCKTFLDLGGHQLIWSTYYAKLSAENTVISFEPSILNVVIGLFNCFINDVIDRVDVIPFAVLSSTSNESEASSKMLVDFMTVPLQMAPLNSSPRHHYDFIKTDIEGYEYELLSDPHYLNLISHAKISHLELHLGHLTSKGVSLKNWIEKLKKAGIHGEELYSQKELYDYLETSAPNGYYSFLVKRGVH